MEMVMIETNSKQYPVYIGSGATSKLQSFIKEKFPTLSSLLIITDETVGQLYLPTLKNALADLEPIHFIVPSGEKAKSFDVYYDCLSFALEKKLDRKSLILSFGGGVVGDLAGFVAATFMRGIPFIQVPTTILAHDSAVGGKVAINHPLGKNMVGAFHQPEAVFYDLNYLVSLPVREVRSGFAEVVKHALIQDAELYYWIRQNIKCIDDIKGEKLQKALVRGIEIKGTIVAEDERESGVRSYLNFGHTLGHAIEAECGYGGLSHGEAVMIGMVFAIKLSKQITGLEFNENELIVWLKELGYQVKLPEGLKMENLLGRMKQDKKSVGQKVRFVLLEDLGKPRLYEIADELLLLQLAEFQK
jgi:3-dehydroquinate synthase